MFSVYYSCIVQLNKETEELMKQYNPCGIRDNRGRLNGSNYVAVMDIRFVLYSSRN